MPVSKNTMDEKQELLPRHSEELPTESTRLWMPSANSTDLASAESLLALVREEDSARYASTDQLSVASSVSEIQLHSFSQRKTESFYDVITKSDHWKGRRRLFILFLAGLALFGLFVYAQSKTGASIDIEPDSAGYSTSGPLSLLDPVTDLELADYDRSRDTRPPRTLEKLSNTSRGFAAFPTNAWYQNMILVEDEPSTVHRAYTIPYVVDAVGPIPGLRVHPNHIGANNDVVQLYVVEHYGLTLGAAIDADASHAEEEPSMRYNIQEMTNLGITLEWEHYPMSSSIVKGIPYATMIYEKPSKGTGNHPFLPTIASEIALAQPPIVDRSTELECGDQASIVSVEKEVEVLFGASDFTWLIFFSRPVQVRCTLDSASEGMRLQVVNSDEDDAEEPLVVRLALHKSCTSGQSAIYCHQELMHPTALLLGQGLYGDILRNHSHLYPGPKADFLYEVDSNSQSIQMKIDWDVQDTRSPTYGSPTTSSVTEADTELIAFALPHHMSSFDSKTKTSFIEETYCTATIIGPACLVESSTWHLNEKLLEAGLRAPRPPAPWAIAALAKSAKEDLNYTLPSYYRRGAGDTYFSGKMLAKLGRIVLVAEEIQELCSHSVNKRHLYSQQIQVADYDKACKNVDLPSTEELSEAVSRLRSDVEIWLNGEAETPFVFDSSWGGVISCGCNFHESGCSNRFPDCPAFSDPGLNFGNGFYNDMHFHYGYHIYAAAVVAHFDHDWGRRFFDKVMLLIRNVANPSEHDAFFTKFRHKDWFQGHSWASGIPRPPYMNGKNQESSSEAIAAYEAIAIYGQVMSEIFESDKSKARQASATKIYDAGQVLLATELTSAKRYWHVTHSPEEPVKIYPTGFKHSVVGMLWNTMAQFQTWFGNARYLMFGIQLLPLTAVSEDRDTVSWVKEIYQSFASSCEADKGCTETGWSVLQIAMLATVGHQKLAMEKVLEMSPDHFDGPAGNGHSRSNTLWYVATRPDIEKPLSLADDEDNSHPAQATSLDCGVSTCTDQVLDTIAGLYSCRQRINWLIQQRGFMPRDACAQVAGVEHKKDCGACDPSSSDSITTRPPSTCPPCTPEECSSDLNRCPRYDRTFVCTNGANQGGCTGSMWDTSSELCTACCELTNCVLPEIGAAPEDEDEDEEVADNSSCPPCEKDICRSRLNQCPAGGSAPYLCYEGSASGGCAPKPWSTSAGPCQSCCDVAKGCRS